ncbi:hypothetical protein JL721_9558 [Aureococcus anophagefferens]|nr:hypothetical protein JL721_9558 [Aureococcus anophagefferens]
MSEIILSLGTQRTGDGLNSCDASECGSDAMDADTELAEDESWYKEAYGTFNKRKFGLGAVPENGDRVTKFYNKGKAYDGSVTKIYRADVNYRRGGQTRRMTLWEINFDDGDWAELSEIEAVAARQAYLRRTRMPTLFGN